LKFGSEIGDRIDLSNYCIAYCDNGQYNQSGNSTLCMHATVEQLSCYQIRLWNVSVMPIVACYVTSRPPQPLSDDV